MSKQNKAEGIESEREAVNLDLSHSFPFPLSQSPGSPPFNSFLASLTHSSPARQAPHFSLFGLEKAN